MNITFDTSVSVHSITRVRSITLTEQEQQAYDLYRLIVTEDAGVPAIAAAAYALSILPSPDNLFALWLSDGSLMVQGGRVEGVPFGRYLLQGQS